MWGYVWHLKALVPGHQCRMKFIPNLRKGLPGGSVVKNLPANAGDARDTSLIPSSGRDPGVGNSNPFRYSCLENSLDIGAWQATVYGITKSHTRLSTHALEVKSLSRVRLFATPCTAAYQAPLSMGFSRQEYWSGLPFPSPGDLPNPGIEPRSPALQADALPSEPPGKPKHSVKGANNLLTKSARKLEVFTLSSLLTISVMKMFIN